MLNKKLCYKCCAEWYRENSLFLPESPKHLKYVKKAMEDFEFAWKKGICQCAHGTKDLYVDEDKWPKRKCPFHLEYLVASGCNDGTT